MTAGYSAMTPPGGRRRRLAGGLYPFDDRPQGRGGSQQAGRLDGNDDLLVGALGEPRQRVELQDGEQLWRGTGGVDGVVDRLDRLGAALGVENLRLAGA